MNSKPSDPLGRWRFGQFEVDLSTGELRKSGLRIRIQEQPLRILGALLERPGELVSREDLRERLWPSNTFVDFERSLNAAVAKLRQALADSAEQPRYVETVARGGYRFIAPVESLVASLPNEPRASEIDSVARAVPDPVLLHKPSRRAWITGTLFISATIVIGIVLAVTYFRDRQLEVPVVRSSIAPPDKAVFADSLAISPDSRRLVFSASTADGRNHLWVRSLDSLVAQPLAGTEGARHPFWSPDSRFLGFFADGKLQKVDASGGAAVTLCGAPNGEGGTWNRNGVIVFAPTNHETPLYRVSAAGGIASSVTTLDRSRAETTHRWPWFLPDGQHFLYLAGNAASGGTIRLASIDSNVNDSKVLVDSMFNAAYAKGNLLFLREATLLALPFDTKRLVTGGDAVPIAEMVETLPDALGAVFSVSESGDLVYRTGGSVGGAQLAWFDRRGKRIALLGDPGFFGTVHLSPDSKNASVSMLDAAGRNRDVWLYEVSRGIRTRFTSDPAEERESSWSPDGRTIVFNSNRRGHFDLFAKPSSGLGSEELLLASDVDKYPAGFSPDGQFLLYWTQGDPKTKDDLWVLPMTAPRKPFPFAQTTFNEYRARFAPNGRWVAYESDESGRYEIYISSFPGPGNKVQISTGGGTEPTWRGDGKEIFYVAADRTLMAQEVGVNGKTPEAATARPLFGPLDCASGWCYDTTSDGQRFLIRTEHQTNAESLTLVQNWAAAFKK